MHWIQEPPEEPGYYWARLDTQAYNIMVVQVERTSRGKVWYGTPGDQEHVEMRDIEAWSDEALEVPE